MATVQEQLELIREAKRRKQAVASMPVRQQLAVIRGETAAPEPEPALREAAAARLAAQGTSLEQERARAAAEPAEFESFKQALSAGGTPVTDEEAERAWRSRATAQEVGAASKSAVAAGLTGLGEGALQTITTPADILSHSPMETIPRAVAAYARGRVEGGSRVAGFGAAMEEALPATMAVSRQAEEDLATARRQLGVPEGAVTDVGDAIMRLGGNVAVPGPEVALGGRVVRGASKAASVAQDATSLIQKSEKELWDSAQAAIKHEGKWYAKGGDQASHSALRQQLGIPDQPNWPGVEDSGWIVDGETITVKDLDATQGSLAEALAKKKAAPPTFTAEALQQTFKIAPEEAKAAEAIADAMGLDRRKIDLEVGGEVSDVALRQAGEGRWYYDNIDRTLDSWQGKGTPEQLVAHLKKSKGSMDEAETIGLTDWLADKKSVTRDDVREFVKANRVEVEEVVRTPADTLSRGADGEYGLYSDYSAGGKNYRETLLTVPNKKGDAFTTEHFPEPNVIAHFRTNERTLPDGRRVLFVDELQSDWHQAGRKRGYYDPSKPFEVVDESGAIVEQFAKRVDAEKMVDEDPFSFNMRRASAMDRVPEGPFKGDGWKRLALKRILADASDKGYDGVAWTPGSLQNERYGKALDDPGMIGFYDRELPNLANDITKRFGTRTSRLPMEVTTDAGRTAIDAHFIELPESARNAIKTGKLPLFQGTKGATEFADGGRAIIRALESPDVSTAVHELAHTARRFLFDRNIDEAERFGITAADIEVAEKWAGAADGAWDEAAEEVFASGFERYLRDGTSPSDQLSDVFEKFKQWLTRIYDQVTGSSIDVQVSPEMREVFDRLVTRRERAEAAGRGGDLPRYVETSGAEVTSRPQSTTPFDKNAYMRELRAEYEAAKTRGDLSGTARFWHELEQAKAAVVDSLAPIEDAFRAAVKATGRDVIPSEDITNALDNVLMAPHMAGAFARGHGLEAVLRESADTPDGVFGLGQYLLARHAPYVEAQGFTSGRDLVKDAAMLDANRAIYEPLAKRVDKYVRDLLEYRGEAGLISRKYVDYVNATYPEYVPIIRVFSEAEGVTRRIGGGGPASISRQTTDLPLKGSSRVAEDPIESLLIKTMDSFKQGETAKTAKLLSTYHDLSGNPFGLEPLRTAENAQKRVGLIDDLGVIGREQRKFRRVAQSVSRQLGDTERGLKRQFERMNRRIAETSNESQAIYDAMRVAAANFEPGSIIDDLLADGIATERKIRGLIERVDHMQERLAARLESKGLTAERRLYELQGKREQIDYGTTAEARTELKETLNGLKTAIDERTANVRRMREELVAARDIKKKPTDSTISFPVDGVWETWKINPVFAKAAKGMDIERLNLLGRILSVPTRILKLGATGLNAVFISRNIPRDQALAAILSEHSASVMNPVTFGAAMHAAVGHGGLFQEAVQQGALFTSFDIAREAPELTVDALLGTRRAFRRARQSGAKATAKYIVTSPKQLLRAAEDIVSRSEQLTRVQVYKGTRDALIAKGMSAKEARIAGKRAALWTTGPFHRSGQWGRVLNGAIPYLNANIQGWRVLLRGLKERPQEVSAKIAAMVLMPVAGAVAWNMATPERRAAWEDIDEREKSDYLILVPPEPTQDERGRWNVIKIPLAQGVNDLVAPVRRVGEWTAYRALEGDERAIDVMATLLGPEDGGNEMVSTLTPQAIRPTVEVATGQNIYTGRKLIPRRLERTPVNEQVQPWTSGTARIIGKSINASPIKVEHFIRASAGGGGAQTLNTSDAMLAWLGIIPKEQIGGESVPSGLSRTFTKAYGGAIERRKRAETQ